MFIETINKHYNNSDERDLDKKKDKPRIWLAPSKNVNVNINPTWRVHQYRYCTR